MDYLLLGGPLHGRIRTVPDNLRELRVATARREFMKFSSGKHYVDVIHDTHIYVLFPYNNLTYLRPVDSEWHGYGIYQGAAK